MRLSVKHIVPFLLAAFFTACTNSAREGAGILVKMGERELTIGELRANMPQGLSQADSTRIARAYIRSWIDTKLMSEYGAEAIGDMAEIDRLTEQYRNQLIAYEYRRRIIAAETSNAFSPDSLKAFYDANAGMFVARQPLVRGIYIKIPEDASNLKTIKKLYKSNKLDDIDRLEKECLDAAVHYDYFKDRWVEWDQIDSRIPVDLSVNPDGLLRVKKEYETVSDGFVYLLYISDYIPTGRTLPFEAASDQIVQELTFRRQADLDREMRRQLLKEASEKGTVEIFCDLDS